MERSIGRQEERLDAYGGQEKGSESVVGGVLSSLVTSLQGLDGVRSSKRRRVDEGGGYIPSPVMNIPDDAVLSQVLEAYFVYIHPWTPIIHEGRFRRRLVHDNERQNLEIVLQAMILVAQRYVEDEDSASDLQKPAEESEKMRDWLVSQAMKQPSVENLQALVIVASDDVCPPFFN